MSRSFLRPGHPAWRGVLATALVVLALGSVVARGGAWRYLQLRSFLVLAAQDSQSEGLAAGAAAGFASSEPDRTESRFISWARVRAAWSAGQSDRARSLFTSLQADLLPYAEELPDGYLLHHLTGLTAGAEPLSAMHHASLAMLFGARSVDAPLLERRFYELAARLDGSRLPVNRVRLLMHAGLFPEAVMAADDALGNPALEDDVRARAEWYRGRLAESLGNRAEAALHFRRSIESSMNVFGACRLWSLTEKGDSRLQIQRALVALAAAPQIPEPAPNVRRDIVGAWYSHEDMELGPLVEVAYLVRGSSVVAQEAGWVACQLAEGQWILTGTARNLITNGGFEMAADDTEVPGFTSQDGGPRTWRSITEVVREGAPTHVLTLEDAQPARSGGISSLPARARPLREYLHAGVMKTGSGEANVSVMWHGGEVLRTEWLIWRMKAPDWRTFSETARSPVSAQLGGIIVWRSGGIDPVSVDDQLLLELPPEQ